MGCTAVLRQWCLFVGLLGALLATGPQPGDADDAPRYPGKIQSFDTPILLRFHPVDRYQAKGTGSIALFQPKQKLITGAFLVGGSITRSDAGLVQEGTMQIDSNSIDPTMNGKISRSRQVIDERGHIINLEIPEGQEFDKEAFLKLWSKFNFTLPEEPVRLGDDLYASDVSIDVVRELNLDRAALERSGIHSLQVDLELHGIVAGLTYVRGHQYLVVNMDGEGAIRSDAFRIEAELHGYSLMDTATALTMDGVLRADITGLAKGETLHATADIMMSSVFD